MAKKGQKFNKYTPEFRAEVVNKYLSGNYSSRMLSIEYGISDDTIWTWSIAYRKGKTLGVSKRGRPKSNEEIDYKERYEILKKFQAFVKAQRKKK